MFIFHVFLSPLLKYRNNESEPGPPPEWDMPSKKRISLRIKNMFSINSPEIKTAGKKIVFPSNSNKKKKKFD